MRYAAEKAGDLRNPRGPLNEPMRCLDHFVIAKTGIDTSRPGANDEVLSSPLVQAELSRQRRDIDELLARDREDIASVARRMRRRALEESQIIFYGNI